jgi:serine/threonine protein kinase
MSCKPDRPTMGSPDRPASADLESIDLLTVIRRSGVLTDREFQEVRARVRSGEYPHDRITLARRLVGEGILTEFQAGRLLQNKSHGLLMGRYVILARLGSGAMGRVFKAQHQLMGRTVALKIIAPRIATRASSLARFHREMRLIGRLDHENVVRAFDADLFGEAYYIVMEYVAGRSLDLLLDARGPLPPAEVADYAAQAALGLAHAHEQGIIHRDVKPSNLLVSEGRRVKILDFGLGALIEADSQATFATAAGRAVGTIDYMSPEQAIGCDLDGRSDLFSLGCTIYSLMTGQRPFTGDTAVERLRQRINGRPVPIGEIRPDLPPNLVKVLNKLLARRPEDRFQTGAEAAEALRASTSPSIAIPSRGSLPPPRVPYTPAPEPVAPPVPSPAIAPPSGCISLGTSLPPRPRLMPFLAARAHPMTLIISFAILLIIFGFGLGFTLGYLTAHRDDTERSGPVSRSSPVGRRTSIGSHRPDSGISPTLMLTAS